MAAGAPLQARMSRLPRTGEEKLVGRAAPVYIRSRPSRPNSTGQPGPGFAGTRRIHLGSHGTAPPFDRRRRPFRARRPLQGRRMRGTLHGAREWPPIPPRAGGQERPERARRPSMAGLDRGHQIETGRQGPEAVPPPPDAQRGEPSLHALQRRRLDGRPCGDRYIRGSREAALVAGEPC